MGAREYVDEGPATLGIGDVVRLNVPAPVGETHGARGVIVAREVYEDHQATKQWFYVRWFNHEGKPDAEPMKHARAELTDAED